MPTAIAIVMGVHGNKNKERIAVTWATSCPTNRVTGAHDLFCLNTAFLIGPLFWSEIYELILYKTTYESRGCPF
jgi:hypothetical protein|tara:strand:- start:1628 stop:1849 length:222 start_codon:yes stop_codon:yes gene_type:complete